MNAIGRLGKSARWRTDGLRAYARAYRATAGWHRTQRVPVDLPGGDRLPVIFCTWHRLERLPQTLAMLAAQDVPVQVLIWNNSPDRAVVDKAVAGAVIPVAVHHCDRNIGGFGRFYLARAAAEAGHGRVVFIDDDLDFGPDAARALARACGQRMVVSRWAWCIRGRYGDRDRAGAGEPAHYAGTCGMAADASVFTLPAVFRCPRRFWFAEDLWLSGFAARNRYLVAGAEADITEVADGRNQNDSLGWVKQRLWRGIER